MIKIEIPGRFIYTIENVIFDFNGTIATRGKISQSTREKINELAKMVNVYVLTADTYSSAEEECRGLDIKLMTFPKENVADCKAEIVSDIGADNCVCYGNGYNDIKMFEMASLKVAVLGNEGMCSELIFKSDVLVKSIDDGIDLLLNPKSLIATLRG